MRIEEERRRNARHHLMLVTEKNPTFAAGSSLVIPVVDGLVLV